MTELEWLASTDLAKKLNPPMGDRLIERKTRLFMAACCRRIWHLMTDERSRKAVEAVEEYADGKIEFPVLAAATQDAREALASVSGDYRNAINTAYWATDCSSENPFFAYALSTAGMAAHAFSYAPTGVWNTEGEEALDEAGESRKKAEFVVQSLLLNCILGPSLFRSVTMEPSWRTENVSRLAQMIYSARDFDALPFLADALEETGCTNVEMLAHCRAPARHARGCWVLDLILGKH